MLLAKTPIINSGNVYDYLIMFEHENVEVVKHVMRFLANGVFLVPHDTEEGNVMIVDLPDLYRHGMKKIAPELLTAEQTQTQTQQLIDYDRISKFVAVKADKLGD